MGRPPPFESPVSGENIAAVLVDSVSMATLQKLTKDATDEQSVTATQA